MEANKFGQESERELSQDAERIAASTIRPSLLQRVIRSIAKCLNLGSKVGGSTSLEKQAPLGGLKAGQNCSPEEIEPQEVEFYWPDTQLQYLTTHPVLHHEREQVWNSLEEAIRSTESNSSASLSAGSKESELESLRRRLVVWARDEGREIDFEAFREKLAGKEVGRGEEHLVFLDEATCRVVKVTAGENYGARGIQNWIRNLRRSNQMFGDDTHLMGAIISPDETLVRLVISQPFREGDTPTSTEIEKGLKERGFTRVGALAFYNPSSEECIADAKPDNLVKLLNGELFPIDVHLPVLNDRTKEVYENIVRSI